MTAGQAATARTKEEIASAICALTPADWARLKKVAQRYAFGRPIGAEDLLQEALARANEDRICPRHVDVVKFLAEAMRSIAFDESEKVEHRLRLVSVAKTGDHQAEAFNYPDGAPSAEAKMISEQQVAEMRQALLSLFDDDPLAQDIVDGSISEMTAEEIQEITGLDKTAYNSKRRLIRRRIEKAYPEGWKS